MKKLTVVVAICISASAFGQTKEGRVVYDRTVQQPARTMTINGEAMTQPARTRTDQFELLFANNQSLWQYLPSINSDDQNTFTTGNMTIRTVGGGPGGIGGTSDIAYCNFDKGVRVDHREVAEKSFIVTDSIKKLNWKITGETKSILGHTAFKAKTTRTGTRSRMTMENGELKRTELPDTVEVVAWYSPDFPVPAGPEFQGHLPGLILELELDKGQTVYKAVEISSKVSASKVKEPKDGKKVTAAQFIKERDALMDEMRKMMQNGNMFRGQ